MVAKAHRPDAIELIFSDIAILRFYCGLADTQANQGLTRFAWSPALANLGTNQQRQAQITTLS
jgi:hypothetical protein